MSKPQPLTVAQMREADRWAIQDLGIPSLALMENAGAGAAREILALLADVSTPRVTVVCGLGNNAGDGFVIARHFLNAGIKPTVFLLGPPEKLSEDAYVNYRVLNNIEYPIKQIVKIDQVTRAALAESDLIVDAIFGSGLSRTVEGLFAEMIKAINAANKRVVAVDIPSGLDGTTGEIHGVCMKADTTVAFHAPKTGFYEGQGPEFCGKIVVVHIGVPERSH